MNSSEGHVICSECGGRGVLGEDGSPCPMCGGSGEVPAADLAGEQGSRSSAAPTQSALFAPDPGVDAVDQPPLRAAEAPQGSRSGRLVAREVSFGSKGLVLENLQGALQFAELALQSGMLPKHLKTPGQAVMVMQAGMDVGLSVTQAFNYILPIQNRLTIWGEGAKGLVQTSGKLTGWTDWWTLDGERIELRERAEELFAMPRGLPDSLTAGTKLHRKGGLHVEREFSVGDAKRYQVRSTRGYSGPLFNKPGPWREDPLRMLRIRAFSRAMRDLFADCLGGLSIAEEELDISAPAEREAQVMSNVADIGPKSEAP